MRLSTLSMAVGITFLLIGNSQGRWGTQSEVFTRTLPFEPGQRLEIHQKVGDIVIKPGQASGITVVATKKTKGSTEELKKIDVSIEAKSDGVCITTDWKQEKQSWLQNLLSHLVNDQGNKSVDFVINLPKKAEIEINSGVGDIDIKDVEGNIDVDLGVGDVILKYPAGAEKSNCNLQIGVGDINLFYLAAGATKSVCRLETGVGDIKVSFAAGVSARIDAICGVGEIMSEIPRLSVSSEHGPGDSGIFQLGEVEGNSFKLKTGTGDITLNLNASNPHNR